MRENDSGNKLPSDPSNDEFLPFFTPQEQVQRRAIARTLLLKKVSDLKARDNETQQSEEQRRMHLEQILTKDPRYIEISMFLKHPDMEAVLQSLEEYFKNAVASLPETSLKEYSYFGRGIDGMFDKPDRKKEYPLQRYTLLPGIIWNPTSPNEAAKSDESILTSSLTDKTYLGRTGVFTHSNYSYHNEPNPWHIEIGAFWDNYKGQVGVRYYDSSDTQSPIYSTVNETINLVARTMSKDPVLFAFDIKKWNDYISSRHMAIEIFKTLMSKNKTSFNKLKAGQFNALNLITSGAIDEIVLIVEQIHNQFAQTDLLRQIAGNTHHVSDTYRVSAASQSTLESIESQLKNLANSRGR